MGYYNHMADMNKMGSAAMAVESEGLSV